MLERAVRAAFIVGALLAVLVAGGAGVRLF